MRLPEVPEDANEWTDEHFKSLYDTPKKGDNPNPQRDVTNVETFVRKEARIEACQKYAGLPPSTALYATNSSNEWSDFQSVREHVSKKFMTWMYERHEEVWKNLNRRDRTAASADCHIHCMIREFIYHWFREDRHMAGLPERRESYRRARLFEIAAKDLAEACNWEWIHAGIPPEKVDDNFVKKKWLDPYR
ncbi:MAG: hypothetical protein Q9223_001042 [Gallowayella weberi]